MIDVTTMRPTPKPATAAIVPTGVESPTAGAPTAADKSGMSILSTTMHDPFLAIADTTLSGLFYDKVIPCWARM